MSKVTITNIDQLRSAVQQWLKISQDRVKNEKLAQLLMAIADIGSATDNDWIDGVDGVHNLTKNIGIGISKPEEKLHINGGGLLMQDEDDGTNVVLWGADGIQLPELGTGAAPFAGIKRLIQDKNVAGNNLIEYFIDSLEPGFSPIWGIIRNIDTTAQTKIVFEDTSIEMVHQIIGSNECKINLDSDSITLEVNNDSIGTQQVQVEVYNDRIFFKYNGTTVFGLNFQGATPIISAVLPTYADNTAATTGGLAPNDLYKTATGEVRIVV